MDFSNYKFRCSRLGSIMTNIESDKLTKGHITTCKKIHREETWKRKPILKSKYIEKGNTSEEDAITLLSLTKKTFFEKNSTRIENEFLSGEPDLYIGEGIRNVKEGFDTKCSWSHETFPFKDDDLDSDYKFQDHGYIALTNAERWTTVYCLVNASGSLITQEQKNKWFKMGCPEETNPEYIEACIEIEKDMIFDMALFTRHNPGFDSYALRHITWEFDIPKEERIIEFVVERNNKIIDRIYERVAQCRELMNSLSGKLIEVTI